MICEEEFEHDNLLISPIITTNPGTHGLQIEYAMQGCMRRMDKTIPGKKVYIPDGTLKVLNRKN